MPTGVFIRNKVIDGKKECTRHPRCFPNEHNWLPATTEFFHTNFTIQSGLHSWCHRCDRVYYKVQREKNTKLRALELPMIAKKKCSRHSQCFPNEDSLLPKAKEYFIPNLAYHDGFKSWCRKCDQMPVRRKTTSEWIIRRDKINEICKIFNNRFPDQELGNYVKDHHLVLFTKKLFQEIVDIMGYACCSGTGPKSTVRRFCSVCWSAIKGENITNIMAEVKLNQRLASQDV